MSVEVRFEVEAARVEEHYGVTLFVHDAPGDPPDGTEVPCYFLVFQGPQDGDPSEVARNFSICHQEAMDSCGVRGQMTEDQFAKMLEDSVELAGELMVRHGLKAVDVDTVDEDMMCALFDDGLYEETDPKLLN